MQVIPCIDIRAGKCVRLLQGQADQQTVYGDDPVAMAQRWVEAGAPLLHIVDLDGAFAGQMHNFEVIQATCRQILHTVTKGANPRKDNRIGTPDDVRIAADLHRGPDLREPILHAPEIPPAIIDNGQHDITSSLVKRLP